MIGRVAWWSISALVFAAFALWLSEPVFAVLAGIASVIGAAMNWNQHQELMTLAMEQEETVVIPMGGSGGTVATPTDEDGGDPQFLDN